MAVSRSDIKRWRLDAEDAVGSDLGAQLRWLRQRRGEYSAKVAAGDVEVTSDSFEGASTQAKRHASDRENHDAILAAIEQVEAELGTGGKSRGTLLGFRIRDITG